MEASEIVPTSLNLILGCLKRKAALLVPEFSVIKPAALVEVDLHMDLVTEKCGVSIRNAILNAKPFPYQLAPVSRH